MGIFEGQSDVGSVTPPGILVYDPAAHTYTIAAAGANLWSTVDAFHFVWKKVSGDVSLTADIDFPAKTENPNPHRKALLMFRQSLDTDGVYADAAQHGSGLTALQYRLAVGATTQDIELDTLLQKDSASRNVATRSPCFSAWAASRSIRLGRRSSSIFTSRSMSASGYAPTM